MVLFLRTGKECAKSARPTFPRTSVRRTNSGGARGAEDRQVAIQRNFQATTMKATIATTLTLTPITIFFMKPAG
jgi:hypothetical protein